MADNQERCARHPKFDPFKKSQWGFHNKKYIDCPVCSSLHFGTLKTGELRGEYESTIQHIISAKTIIGPLGLLDFGFIRNKLFIEFQHENQPWRVDPDMKMIYLDYEVNGKLLTELKKRKCPVFFRNQGEQNMSSAQISISLHDGKENLSVPITAGTTMKQLYTIYQRLVLRFIKVPNIN